MKRFFIKTHGCKANQLESEIIKEKLIEAGFNEVANVIDADYCVLNSCSVTETADNEALRTLRNIKHKNPSTITILTGCSAQLNYEKFKEFDYIDLALGNNDKFSIVEAIKYHQSQVQDIFSVIEFNNQFINNYSKTRGYLKIQDGCNNYCSYCTIPLARGKSRSNSVKNIIEQVNKYTDCAIQEIVLTGIHIGQWGEDFAPKSSLYHLLEEIENTDIRRYRLGSLNTLEIDDNLLNFLSQSEKFCPHFHLSLQSLNDKTLLAMNRKYTAESCLELMQKINQMFKLPFLGSDIIVGFPDESNDDFLVTLENAKKSLLSNIHVFPYSIRENTKAAKLENQLNEKIKQERANILRKVAKQKYQEFIQLNIGSIAEVLIEKKPDKKNGILKGVTKNYLNVYLDSQDTKLCNTIKKVKIAGFSEISDNLQGTII